MQESFDFLAPDIAWWRARLRARFGRLADVRRRGPLGEMIKSLIGGRTRDAVSLAAFRRLVARWPRAADLARAAPAVIERTIFDVTFADRKSQYLPAALVIIRAERPDFTLSFLGGLTVPAALPWLERLPGVGRKVAAATLNASTLAMPAFIVDSHVHRVLCRLGVIGEAVPPGAASALITASAGRLGADDFLELFAQMKRLGQTLCRFDAPVCDSCPLAARCRPIPRASAPCDEGYGRR